MGGDQKDTGPMDDLSDESDEAVVTPRPVTRPKPVARVGQPAGADNDTFVDLSDDLEPNDDESLGDLPGPTTQPGTSPRIALPTPRVGPASLVAAPQAAVPDPSSATDIFPLKPAAAEPQTPPEEAAQGPADAAPAMGALDPASTPEAAVPDPSRTPEGAEERQFYSQDPPPKGSANDEHDDIPVRRDRAPVIAAVIGVGMMAAAALAFVAFTGGGLGLYAYLTGDDPALIDSGPPIAVTPPTAPEAAGPEYYVAVSSSTVLAQVEINGDAHKCTIVEYERRSLEAVQLDWPNLSSYERWEICGKHLKKGPEGENGGHQLVIASEDGTSERSINLKDVIITAGSSNYTLLPSVPGALARCWGAGQTNGDGQPTCSPKPPQFAELHHQAEPEDDEEEPTRTEAPPSDNDN